MTICKENALGRKSINVWCLDFLGSITTEVPVAHVICQDEEDVGRLLFVCFPGVGLECQNG
jgi:hypothetical protein